jgi:hypothetical protein
MDLKSICAENELVLLETFAARVSRAGTREFEVFRRAARFTDRQTEESVLSEIEAFRKGLALRSLLG